MEQLTSEGKCVFCSKTFKKAGISRHLNTHLAQKIQDNKSGISFHIRVEQDSHWGASPYFLNLWVDGNTSLKLIDDFLRKIWLECCGHMSAFRNPKRRQGYKEWDLTTIYDLFSKGEINQYDDLMEDSMGEIPMNKKAKDIFYKDLKLEYEYDFGSTTSLQVKVIDKFTIKADKSIILLLRNPPQNNV